MGEGLEGVQEGEGVEFVRGRVNQVIRLLQHLADVDRVAMMEEILKQRFMTIYARHSNVSVNSNRSSLTSLLFPACCGVLLT